MKIGFFEAGLPNCEHDAGSTAVVELCALVKAMGHNLEYIYTGENPWGRTSDLARSNIPHSQIALIDSNKKIQFLQHKKLDIALISRPGPAIEWLHSCNAVGLPIIYFGHDIHHIRLLRGNMFLEKEKQVNLRDIKLMQIIEQNLWQRTAAVIYPSQQECDIVNNYSKKQHAFEMPIYNLLGAYESFCNHPFTQQKTETHNLLFVGGVSHAPNYDAIMWFTQEVFSHINMNFTLSVVGNWPESAQKEVLANWHANNNYKQEIVFSGMLPQEKLYDSYHQADLVIAPLRFGAGIKRKVVESFSFQRPLLGTEISFEGVELPDNLAKYFLAKVNGKDYASKIMAFFSHNNENIHKEIEAFSKLLISKYNDNYRKKILEKAFSFL